MAPNGMSLFGFKINPSKDMEQTANTESFAMPQTDDGAVNITTGGYFGTYVDLEGVVRNEVELITRYREMSMQPEMEAAIDNIVNDAIVTDESGTTVTLNLDSIKISENIKKRIQDEFKLILRLLDFKHCAHDVFRRWYVDGRIFYNIMIDEDKPYEGIKELRYIDPRRIRKIREIQKTKDPRTGIEIIKSVQEYYLYNERGVIGAHSNLGAKIATDSVVNVNSGLMDSRRAIVLSYLHKAIKPLNQLRMMEDATVIYRISRAPERRVFYIDVGNLPKGKAEQYLKDIMVKYRNKLVYDSNTGEIQNDRKQLSMLEDFFLPRREGGKGTEIDTLKGGENLGKMEDVDYFQKKLYMSLSVPISRLIPDQGFSLGRSTEITRDELNFNKFVCRLRVKFASLFDDLLRVQLTLKKVCTEDEWLDFREDLFYDFLTDNNFEELKEAELWSNRVNLLTMMDPFIGRFFSGEFVQKDILKLTDEQIERMTKQIEQEKAADSDLHPLSPEEQADLEARAKGGGDEGDDDEEEDEADGPETPPKVPFDKSIQNLTGNSPFATGSGKSSIDSKVKSLTQGSSRINTVKKSTKKKGKK